jgi:nitrate reductase gamma subunit
MVAVPYIVAYTAVAVFVVAVIARFIMWSKLPFHLRWELYPVPHEGKRSAYGGSYLEQTDWWKKPRETSLVGELKVMFSEILFLVALREHNRKMWFSSYPFHSGIYLVSGATLVMIARAILGAISPEIVAGSLGTVLGWLCIVCGAAGLCLGIAGALGLLHRRLTNPDLKDFTAPADIFNLVFFVVAFGFALGHFLSVDRDMSRSMLFVDNLVTFNMASITGPALWLTMTTVVLLGVLLAYIPLTHMSHFVGKYFAYHAIRWNDDPNVRGGRYEAKVKKVLNYPISWSADHVKGDGKKTWAEVATERQKK